MTESNEILKSLFQVLSKIAAKEMNIAVQRENYGAALIAGILEGIFKEAEKVA